MALGRAYTVTGALVTVATTSATPILCGTTGATVPVRRFAFASGPGAPFRGRGIGRGAGEREFVAIELAIPDGNYRGDRKGAVSAAWPRQILWGAAAEYRDQVAVAAAGAAARNPI